MDKKTLIKNLRILFTNEYKCSKKYTRVWLSLMDSFYIPKTRRYVLHVQLEHYSPNSYDETKELVDLLHEKANEELKTINSVDVLEQDEEYFYDRYDMVIFEEPEDA